MAKDESEYAKNTSRPDGLQTSCKGCHRQYVNAHYQAHKPYYKAKARKNADAHYAEREAWINNFKSGPCLDCGGRFPPCAMDFDHVRGTKIDNVSWMRVRGRSKASILAEIAKCELVCANCHRIRTHSRLGT